jgi:hypothetical protein
MATVVVTVDTPGHERVIQEGQPATTIAAYKVEVPDGQSVADAMAAQLPSLPIGSEVCIANADAFETFVVASSLEPVAAAVENPLSPMELIERANEAALEAEIEAAKAPPASA